ncbi:MAG: MbtH family NRPS accessory protein [Burkholderiaceae bacterium]
MTTSCFDREDEIFIVLINKEGQYSLWPHWKKVPGGWEAVTNDQGERIQGDKKTVSEYVEKHWTDMRPRSLQESMARRAAGTSARDEQPASIEA